MAQKVRFLVYSNSVQSVDIGGGKTRFLAPNTIVTLPITGEVLFLEKRGMLRRIAIHEKLTAPAEEKIEVKKPTKKVTKKKKGKVRRKKSKDGDK